MDTMVVSGTRIHMGMKPKLKIWTGTHTVQMATTSSTNVCLYLHFADPCRAVPCRGAKRTRQPWHCIAW